MNNSCPVCGGIVLRSWPAVSPGGANRSWCSSCHHVWIGNLPLRDPVYDANYNKHFRRPQDAVKAGAVVAQIADVITQYKLDKSILEIGPGNAWSAWLLRQAGYDISTAELHPLQILYVRNSIMVPCNTLDSYLIQKNRKFSLVYASHVVEHVRDFRKFLTDCRSVLKPGGVIFLDTPCSNFALSNLPDWHHCNTRDPFEHVHLFSTSSIKIAAQSVGLRLTNCKLWEVWGSMHVIFEVDYNV